MPPQNPRRPAGGQPAKPAKPAPKKKRAWESEHVVGAADFLADQTSAAEARNGTGVFVGTEAERAVIGLPLRAFSLQYLHSSDTYPLGRMELLAGESDSCKTALLFEMFRWFLREPQAGAVYELNEARDPSDLRTSIVGREYLSDGRFRLEGPCESLEHWQRNVTALLHKFENKFKVSGGCAFPFVIGLDSVTGTTNERVIQGIDEVGCATLTYGQDANLLNMYSKYLFQRLHKWPISFVTTSHVKFVTDKYGNKQPKIPGGDSLRYVSTYILFMKKLKDIERQDVAGGRQLELKMIKSMGEHRKIEVDFVWTFEPEGQRSIWNWHGATVTLLAGFSGKRREEIDEIVTFPNYTKTTQTCACPEVGIRKAAPFDEVGKAIMDTPKVLKALQAYFGIKRRRLFEPGVPYAEQIARAVAAGETAAHDSSDVPGFDTADDGGADDGDADLPTE